MSCGTDHDNNIKGASQATNGPAATGGVVGAENLRPLWMLTRREIIDAIYQAVRADLEAGKAVPVSTALRTTWLKHPEQIRRTAAGVEVYAGRRQGWVRLTEDTLTHWAKVKRLPRIGDHTESIARALQAGADVPPAVLADYPYLAGVYGASQAIDPQALDDAVQVITVAFSNLEQSLTSEVLY